MQDYKNPQGFCFDVESDNFYLESTVTWMIHLKDLNNPKKTITIYPFKEDKKVCKEKFMAFVKSYEFPPFITFHYGLGFDIFILVKFLGIEISVAPDLLDNVPVHFIDSFYLSMYLQPDLQGHGLAAYGERLGLAKIEFNDFSKYTEEMDIYCQRDVELNIKVFKKLWGQFTEIYDCSKEIPAHFICGQKSHYLMSCQEFTGWRFDIASAKELAIRISEMMLEIEKDVEPQLPPRKLKKGEEKLYSMPAKPYKKDGSYSSHMINFIEKHNGKDLGNGVIEFFGKEYKVASGIMLDVKMPMLLGNQEDLKDWFIELGWVSTFWNYKKDEKGKPIRDEKGKLIKASPKIQELGKVCPNLERLQGDLPKKVVKWLSLRNRQSVLNGWLENPRLKIDGRLPAARTGITPTHRQRHSIITNIPKAQEGVLLGKEFRSLFIAGKGEKIVSVDQSGLENRVAGHYTMKYDGGEYAKLILEGDCHSANARYVFFVEELSHIDIHSPDFNKEDSFFKPFRGKSKNGLYSLLYGAAPAKVASTIGKPERDGQKISDRFWEVNKGVGLFRDAITKWWETQGGKKYIPAIDGRRVYTRSKHAIVNSCWQACGAVIMDWAICFLDKALGGIKFDEDFKPYYNYKGYKVKRVSYFHDQLDFECPEEIAEDLKKVVEKCFAKAGKFLKMQVELVGEGNIGNNLKEVH